MWESAHILCTHTLGIECNLLCAWTYVNLIALCVIGRLLWGCMKITSEVARWDPARPVKLGQTARVLFCCIAEVITILALRDNIYYWRDICWPIVDDVMGFGGVIIIEEPKGGQTVAPVFHTNMSDFLRQRVLDSSAVGWTTNRGWSIGEASQLVTARTLRTSARPQGS